MMRFDEKITVELNQIDAAVVAVLLAKEAGRLALEALLADRTAEVDGTTNKGARAVADSYIKVGNALAFAIVDEKKNRGVQSTMSLALSTALATVVDEAVDAVTEATEADE